MSADDDVPHPRETATLFGHGEAEAAFLAAARSGRLHHAWLVGGPRGIGKATLAYRIARFVLAGRDLAARAAGGRLMLTGEGAADRLVIAQGHPDLNVVDRRAGDDGKVPAMIPVDLVRRLQGFFGSTAAMGGYRVAIVDAVDELNRSGANALLKILEEPPAASLFLIVSHAPGQLLPTILSRCRRLMLKPLSTDETAAALGQALGREAAEPDLRAAAEAGEGSVAAALTFVDGALRIVRAEADRLVAALPALDLAALHALGDRIGRDPAAADLVVSRLQARLSASIRVPGQSPARLARVAEVWDKIGEVSREASVYNLDRKPVVLHTFSLAAGVLDRS
jgi:DNA polymerase-3 subunit delta'